MKGIIILSVVLWDFYQSFLVRLNDLAAKRPLPENVKDVYDEAEYKRFVDYRTDNKKLSVIRSTIATLFTLIFLITDLYAMAFDRLPGNDYVKTILLLLIFETISYVVSIPFGYYDTFVIEERYGMNKSTKKTFVLDQIKEYVIGIVLNIGLISLVRLFLLNFGNWGILFTLLAITLVMLVINCFSLTFMKIFNKFTPIEDGELKEELLALCGKYQVSVKAISIMDASRRTTRANAFCTGIGKKKNISLDDNLVNRYSPRQIVAVFAHEFGHAKYKHLPKQVLISILQLAIYVLVIGGMVNVPELFTAFGFEQTNYYFLFVLFSYVSWPFTVILGLVLNFFSRKCEYEADAFAAKEGYGEELVTALKQLSKDSLSNLNPHPWIVALEYSHPTISQRAAAIAELEEKA